jgi:hypothetical protein
MELLTILKIVAALATIAIGLLSAVRPWSVTGFTGLEAAGSRGTTEIRSILGGVFIGLGLAPLLLNTPVAYQVVGIVYLVTAGVRAISTAIDRTPQRSNLISLVSEFALGIILIL